MTVFLSELATASAIGAVLWLVLLCLRPLTSRIFSQTWHYYTGLIPALFFLGAAWVVSPLIQLMYTLMHKPFFNNEVSAVAIPAAVAEPVLASGALPFEPQFLSFDVIMETVGKTAVNTAVTLRTVTPVLFAVWIIGCVLFLLHRSAAYIRLKNAVLRNSTPFTQNCCNLPVVVSPNTATPMLIGVIKPVIVMPEIRFSEQEITLALAHEETHWKRKDMLVKLVLLCVNAIHWFNPVAHIINYTASNSCETACDEILTRNMSRAERLLYGELILSTVEYSSGRHVALSARMSAGKNLKRRLMYMMRFKKTNVPIKALSVIISLMLAFSGGAMAYAASSVTAKAENKNYETPDYAVKENYSELPEGIEIIPNALPADTFADAAAKVLTGFYGLDLNGKTLNIDYKESLDGRLVMPDKERDPKLAILSPALWKISVFIEDENGSDSGWEYIASFTADTGRLYEVNRSYMPDKDLRVPFKCTREDWETSNGIQNPGYVITSFEGNAFSMHVNTEQWGDNLEELIDYVKNETKLNELSESLIEQTRALHDIASSKYVRLSQLFKPGGMVNEEWVINWVDEYVVETLVTSTGGSRAILSFKMDTNEFLWARFEPHIRHNEDVAAAIIIPR